MIENIRLAFQGIWSHKLRSILTMLGIIIGIAAIITIVSTIEGTNEQIKENLIGAGNNVVTVQLNQNGYPYDMSWGSLPSGVRVITDETRRELEDIRGAEKASLYTMRSYADMVYYQNTQFNGQIYGIDLHYLNVYGYQVKSGRGFTQADFDNYRKVVLVDENAVTTLFAGQSPVGKTMELQGDAEKLDQKLGQFYWLSDHLLQKGMHHELHALTGEGLLQEKITSEQDMHKTMDMLLDAPTTTSEQKVSATQWVIWHYHIGGEPDEA